MKKHTLLIIVVFLCFATCKKENKQENFCYSSSLISQVNSGDLAVHGLTYNSNCLIYESMEPYTYKKFSYDGQNRLKKVEIANTFAASFSCVFIPGQSLDSDPRNAKISEYSEFEYDDASRLTKKSYYFISNGNSQLISYQTYEYANNQIIKLSAFNPQGLLTEYHDYKYDDNGNITRDDLYTNISVIKLKQTIIYEFDNKNNPFQIIACEGIPGLYTNKNNITKETFIFYNGTAQSSTTIQNVYEYNSLDYPVKANGFDYKYGKL